MYSLSLSLPLLCRLMKTLALSAQHTPSSSSVGSAWKGGCEARTGVTEWNACRGRDAVSERSRVEAAESWGLWSKRRRNMELSSAQPTVAGLECSPLVARSNHFSSQAPILNFCTKLLACYGSICKLTDKVVETIQTEAQSNKAKKINRASVTFSDTMTYSDVYVIKRRNVGRKNSGKFLRFSETINPQTQEFQQTLSMKNTEKTMHRIIIIKLWKTIRENPKSTQRKDPLRTEKQRQALSPTCLQKQR